MPWDLEDEQHLAMLQRQRDDFAYGCRGVYGDGYRNELFYETLAVYDRQIARLLERKPKEEAA